MKICENGHYYDDVVYRLCPYCDDSVEPALEDDIKTVSLNIQEDMPTMAQFQMQEDPQTISIFRKDLKSDPVVGWLVCISGEEQYKDFKIKPGKNLVGRSFKMDIVLSNDPYVSNTNHLTIIYDPLNNVFFAAPGENMTYVNEKLLVGNAQLEDGDVLGIGNSKFIFVAFCKGGRVWENLVK